MPRSGNLPYDSENPHPESLAVGQKRMGEILCLTDRQVRNLKKAGKLDWAEKVPTGCGGRPNDAFVVQSGTAFKADYSIEVSKAHSHPKKTDLRNGLTPPP